MVGAQITSTSAGRLSVNTTLGICRDLNEDRADQRFAPRSGCGELGGWQVDAGQVVGFR